MKKRRVCNSTTFYLLYANCQSEPFFSPPQIAAKDIKPGSVSKSVLIQGISRDIHQNSANGQIYLGSIQGLLESGIQHKALLPQPRLFEWGQRWLVESLLTPAEHYFTSNRTTNRDERKWKTDMEFLAGPCTWKIAAIRMRSNVHACSNIPPNDLCLDTFIHQRQIST